MGERGGMSKAKVDIAVACSASQHSNWTGNVIGMLLQEQQRGIEIGQIMLVSSAMPDFNKSNMVGGHVDWDFANPEEKDRNEKTDANRVESSRRFLTGDYTIGWKAEWIFWMDDDTVPPGDALSRLLALDKPAVAGLYFNPNPPKNPIAYIKNKDGIGYHAFYDYPYGSLVQVDSVGMGCTLIHRSVYEKIMQEHVVYVRPNGTLWPVHKSDITNTNIPYLSKQPENVSSLIVNGWACHRVNRTLQNDDRSWPFYAMEYGRTEDHYFWEMAAKVGIRPWVDTTITCGHIKPRTMTYTEYREYVNNDKATGNS